MTRKEMYENALKNYELSEKEFLRIYALRDNNDDEYQKEKKKLSERQAAGFVHIVVAYRQYLRSIGKLTSN